jgi:hypothetical protein
MLVIYDAWSESAIWSFVAHEKERIVHRNGSMVEETAYSNPDRFSQTKSWSKYMVL